MGLGILVTTWYDRKRLYRMPPDLMEYIDGAVLEYRKQTRESSDARLGPDPVSAPTDDDAPNRPSSA